MHPDELVYVYGKHLPTSTRASQPNRMGRDGAVWLKIGVVEGQTAKPKCRVSHAIHHFGGSYMSATAHNCFSLVCQFVSCPKVCMFVGSNRSRLQLTHLITFVA